MRLLLSRAYRVRTAPFAVTTEDGVVIRGSRVGEEGPGLVFCHGFMGWHRKRRIVEFIEELARSFTVYALDLRGHGDSGGLCTFGDLEYLDVAAVAGLARSEGAGPLATFGASMGGIGVLRHAAYRGGVDAVVVVSTPARWDGHRSTAVDRLRWLTASAGGRGLARALGFRLTTEWQWPEEPEDVVGRVAPTPLILVHGTDDHFFDEEQAWRLYRRAGDPKRLLLATRFGHAEDGFSPAFAGLVAARLYEVLGLPPPGR